MDTMYQRGRIQEESLYYEQKKHDGSLPLIGVNTFLPREHAGETATTIELIRSTEAEKQAQIANVERFQLARADTPGGPSARGEALPACLRALQRTAQARRNTFASLMDAVKEASLGEITHALYDVGGQYRRNM